MYTKKQSYQHLIPAFGQQKKPMLIHNMHTQIPKLICTEKSIIVKHVWYTKKNQIKILYGKLN